MSISTKAMLVVLTIGGWSARRLDEEVSQEVASNHGADRARAGNYNKCLIDPKADSFRAVKQAEDRIRKYHYSHTLSWGRQSGTQLLPAAQYFEYAAEMQKLALAWQEAVDAFIGDYPTLKAKARKELNGLYKEDDYPNEDGLAAKYSYNVLYLPMPDARDWRVALKEEDEKRIRAQITAEVEKAMLESTRELAERLYEPLKAMADKLAVPGAIFRDSLVDNVREMVVLLPRMNISEDATLNGLNEQARQLIAALDAEGLRKDDAQRADTARQAAAIAKKMKQYMGAGR